MAAGPQAAAPPRLCAVEVTFGPLWAEGLPDPSLSPQLYLGGWRLEGCFCPEGQLRLLPPRVPVVAAAPVLWPS